MSLKILQLSFLFHVITKYRNILTLQKNILLKYYRFFNSILQQRNGVDKFEMAKNNSYGAK